MADCIWDQPAAERSSRNNPDFAELGDRSFVRGLLPIRLENGEEFGFGIWLEVDAARIANAAPPWRARLLGVVVDVGVREPDARPFVLAAREAWLQQAIQHGWTSAEYATVVASFSRAALGRRGAP